MSLRHSALVCKQNQLLTLKMTRKGGVDCVDIFERFRPLVSAARTVFSAPLESSASGGKGLAVLKLTRGASMSDVAVTALPREGARRVDAPLDQFQCNDNPLNTSTNKKTL
jgi:hypothetical protein